VTLQALKKFFTQKSMMYLLFSFVLCRKMSEKKFMKNSTNQHCCQTRWRHQSAFVNGHNYTNAYRTASFPSERSFIL